MWGLTVYRVLPHLLSHLTLMITEMPKHLGARGLGLYLSGRVHIWPSVQSPALGKTKTKNTKGEKAHSYTEGER